jgi:integrase
MRKVVHHAALPFDELPGFLVELRKCRGISPKALEFVILTASRTDEVLGARWSEIDLIGKVWTIPEERMKGGREHRVPLSDRALSLLAEMVATRVSDFVFPGRVGGRMGSAALFDCLTGAMKRRDVTSHGFRSRFRSWAAERTHFPRELAEVALAHLVGDETERAYQRGDLLEKRRKLMEAWSAFVSKPVVAGNVVVPMRGRGAA